MLTRIAVCLVVAVIVTPGWTAQFRTERVFGPEIATGPYKHPACITELKNGDLPAIPCALAFLP